MTGVEGYVESAAIGLLAGRFAAAEALGQALLPPPPTTAFGALLAHITGGADEKTFQPMNVNFGLFPPLVRPENQGQGPQTGDERTRAGGSGVVARQRSKRPSEAAILARRTPGSDFTSPFGLFLGAFAPRRA